MVLLRRLGVTMTTALLSLLVFTAAPCRAAEPAPHAVLPVYSDSQLLEEVQQRAFRYFQDKSDSVTGLTQDRARNDGQGNFPIASTAATGFALAALPVGVEHGWATKEAAMEQARKTLRFISDTLPNEHGFFYHFVDKRSGARGWNSELSSIDTGILLCGALTAGQYFHGDVQELADAICDRVDWPWMLTNGGEKPKKLALSQGWKPESGFLQWDYGGYSEAVLLYLLGMGSKTHPLPRETWDAVKRREVRYGDRTAIQGGPIFMHQMPQNFFPMQGRRDRLGYDYWVSSTNACMINRQFCIDKMDSRRGYGENFWGLNACDAPDGYRAFGAPQGPENGTLSPTGAISSIPFLPELTKQAAQAMYRNFGSWAWGRYGFANAYNLDRNWFDHDVIGIDLGMALLAIENARSGLIWRLIESHPVTTRAYEAAGLQATSEPEPRPLRRN